MSTDSLTFRVEEVKFPSGGTRCAADVYLPDAAGEHAPAAGVVMARGGQVKEGLFGQAEYLVAAGFAVLAVDYRNAGASEGRPRGLMVPQHHVEDLRNGISYLRTRPEVRRDRIGLCGLTLGGGVAVQAAAVDKRVGCVAALNPVALDGWRWLQKASGYAGMRALFGQLEEDWERRFETGEGRRVSRVPASMGDARTDAVAASWAEATRRTHPTFDDEILLESREHLLVWVPEQFIQHVAPTPLLMVANGGHDPVHVLDEIQIAYQKAREPKRLEILPYDTFGLELEPGLGESMRLTAGWFDRWLRQSPPFPRTVSSPGAEEAVARGLAPDPGRLTAARERGRVSGRA